MNLNKEETIITDARGKPLMKLNKTKMWIILGGMAIGAAICVYFLLSIGGDL